MNKALIILSIVAFASFANGLSIFDAVRNGDFNRFNNDEGSSTSDAINFFEGLGEGLGLENASKALINCTYNQTNNLIADIQQMIDDIQKKDWEAVLQDGIDILDQLQEMQNTCPAGAQPFIDEFQPLIDAWNKDQNAVIEQITKNCLEDVFEVLADVLRIVQDFNDSDYFEAGDEFGVVLEIALKGYLNTTQIENLFH